MKIGIIYGFHKFPPKSGGDVHFYQLVKNLVAIGNEVHLFEWNYHPDAVVWKYSKINLLRFIYSVDALYVRLTWGYTDRYIFLKLLRPWVPLFLEINAPLEETPKDKTESNKFNMLIKLLRRWADGVIVVSNALAEYVRKELFRKGDKSICVIPNGSDPDMFSVSLKENLLREDTINIFWMGSAKYPWHGIDIIKQLARRLRRDKKIKFTLLCNPEYIPQDLLDGENVEVVGEVGYLDVPSYLKQADICLCLYDKWFYSKFKYGFYNSPLKLYDYMAAGKPIIATDIGQISEVIRHRENGMLTSNDIDEIERFIFELADNPDFGKKIGDTASDYIKWRYNWRKVAVSTDQFISAVREKRY